VDLRRFCSNASEARAPTSGDDLLMFLCSDIAGGSVVSDRIRANAILQPPKLRTICVAEANGSCQDGLQYLVHIESRSADDGEHLGVAL
jgi:hypothetical protein